MTVPLGNPFALGATGVQTSARVDRLALGASFRPAAAALGAMSGFLYGPAGTRGDLTLLTDTLLRVDPFLAVIQGTHAANQGQYIVPNDTQRDLAVPAKDASLFRRALIVVRVADSLAAGVASSASTDGAWLEIIPGPLVSSNPQLPSMTPYANYLLAGELSIPSVASGQPVTITKYNPRTTSRGGILPVLATDTTAGLFTGQYRDHPSNGPERWDGVGWEGVAGTRYSVHAYRLADSSGTFSGGYYPWGFDAKVDPYNMYDIPTNYFSAPVKGLYLLQGNATFASGTGGQDRGSRWEKTVWAGNVVTVIPGSRGFVTLANTGYVGQVVGPTVIVQLNAGDGVQFKTYHNSGTNIVLKGDNAGGGSTSATMTLLRQLS